ncbi:sensor histidine kinase [Flagellimonas nanhaiensis]|uniref:Sensor histidine kinase n=2 Tax=Flagellimonas nanhaiensis TaxID=2292706 RepID=A0A371JW15_9FLAO|nr:sensor histidine kinase [Allomuricauda nanhaiensis]
MSGKSIGNYPVTYKHHILFWVIYFIFNTLRWGSYYDDYDYSLKSNIIGFPIHMALTYFNIYFLMPKFVFKKKYITYAILMLLSLYAMLNVKFYLTYYLLSTNVWPEGPEAIDTLTFNYGVQMMLGELYVISFVTAIKITIDWLREHSMLHELEKRQLATELRFLRSQVSPHFFFNTLNNIYSLSLTKSDKAPEVILKLSELMRYLLYATDKRKQKLRKEIECIQNYIDLERIRFDDSLEVDVEISGDLDGKVIAPMLLMPLIENSFKHGASQNIGQMKISLNIKVEGDFLYFELTNNIPKEKGKSTLPTRSGGIGLSNVRKRLELGYPAEDYELRLEEKNNNFNVLLKLRVSKK